jgi:hypothetical protein
VAQALQGAEKLDFVVILSAAKNPRSVFVQQKERFFGEKRPSE